MQLVERFLTGRIVDAVPPPNEGKRTFEVPVEPRKKAFSADDRLAMQPFLVSGKRLKYIAIKMLQLRVIP